MSKARKLPSGSWNVQVFDGRVDGKARFVSFTAPTKDEAELLAAEYKTGRKKKKVPAEDLTVGEAVNRYIELSGVLSPTTLKSYERIRRFAFPDLMPVPVSDLSPERIQEAINAEARRKTERTAALVSPKTVKNEWGLVAAALKEVCGLSFSPKLPPVPRKVKELPEPSAVMAAVVGSSIELPCLLAMWLSLSMSEIRGLTCSSVHDGALFVRQVLVDVGTEAVLKQSGKTATRLRKLDLPPYLSRLIYLSEPMQNYAQTGSDGPLVPLTRGQIYERWKTICSKARIRMSFHDLRHMNASIMLLLGVPEKYAMERGGWSTPHVMKAVYQHTFSSERQRVDAVINDYFGALLGDSLNKV